MGVEEEQASPRRRVVMPRSHSDTDMNSRDVLFGNLQKEKAMLEQQLRQKVQPKPQGVQPQVQREQQEVTARGLRSGVHPSLYGMIPLPHAREVEKDSKRVDPEFLAQLQRHRRKWGPVWVSSHYFNHRVYKRNMPKRGIPIDTSGDGLVDSLAFDVSGNGKVDLIITDDYSEKLAKGKKQHIERTRSLS